MTLQERLREAYLSTGASYLQEAADRIDALEAALRAIITQWDTPNWKLPELTGEIINSARAAFEDK